MTARYSALLSIIASATLVGCGGGLPASYTAEVNKICAAANAEIRALPTSEKDPIAGLEKEDSIITASLNKIKAIAPPSSGSSGVRTWLGVFDQVETDMDHSISDLMKGDAPAALFSAQQGKALDAQAYSDATSLGLPTCAVTAELSPS